MCFREGFFRERNKREFSKLRKREALLERERERLPRNLNVKVGWPMRFFSVYFFLFIFLVLYSFVFVNHRTRWWVEYCMVWSCCYWLGFEGIIIADWIWKFLLFVVGGPWIYGYLYMVPKGLRITDLKVFFIERWSLIEILCTKFLNPTIHMTCP
jgi:hypothetical protein